MTCFKDQPQTPMAKERSLNKEVLLEFSPLNPPNISRTTSVSESFVWSVTDFQIALESQGLIKVIQITMHFKFYSYLICHFSVLLVSKVRFPINKLNWV